MHIKFIFLFSFVSFLILDYLIKNNYLRNSIKKFYLKFIELNYFNIVSSTPVDLTITKHSNGTFETKSNINPSTPLEDELYLAHLIDVLQNSFNLYICVFIIINLTIIFFILKSISELSYNFDWLSKYKYGNKVRLTLLKILSYWRNSTLLFFYLGLFMIWLFSGINIIFIKYVLYGLKSL